MKSFTRIKKINGQEYIYEITPYYDKEKKQIRQKSSMISKRAGAKRGRPKKNESLEVGYLVKADVERNDEIIASERSRLGRFVLASNDKNIDGELMLQHYKGQNAVEKGFRFLKDKSFRVAEVYLKKEERIDAISMIMVLALLITPSQNGCSESD